MAGDITAAMPYRAMTNIINFIQAMDYVVPGFAAYETLLYSPELKFYSNRVKMDTDFNTSLRAFTAWATAPAGPGLDDGLRHGCPHGPQDRGGGLSSLPPVICSE